MRQMNEGTTNGAIRLRLLTPYGLRLTALDEIKDLLRKK
ncbi:hypothetical protein [Methylomonas fluvii]|nr:hypothetical protein [Methylomonas fluvii]